MISVEEALALVLAHAAPLAPEQVDLEHALGLVLAEEVASDVDSPPHDKSLVDGYAVCASDGGSGKFGELEVLEEVVAGAVPTKRVVAGTATRIMTGAPIPEGADSVVMVEQTELVAGNLQRVRIHDAPPRVGQNIMRRGVSIARGAVVLSAGHCLGGAEIGLLAEVGRSRVLAHRRAGVAVLATGNELVEPSAVPGPGQIRNSNGPMLAALVREAEGEPVSLGIARDTEDDLRRLIARGLEHDVLLLSGGVSEGVLDLVPRVLHESGVRQVFHKVNLKPGKPLWFGVREEDSRRTLVFGLPGNPVSSLVGFQLFARPALAQLAGRRNVGLPSRAVPLTKAHAQRGTRPTYWPAAWRREGSELRAEPLAWQGSGDLRTLASADGLAFFPGEERTYETGESVQIRYWREPVSSGKPIA